MLRKTKTALLGGYHRHGRKRRSFCRRPWRRVRLPHHEDRHQPVLREDARRREAAAEELGISLSSFAGQFDGDNETQVAAIETCIASGASGILITASDTAAIAPALAQAQEAGLLIIALDTPLDPADAADSTFATDNFEAGRLIGAWAAGQLGDEAANARVAFLNIIESQPTVGVLRNQGFMTGFGIDVGDPSRWGDETDPRIAGQDISMGSEEGGRDAMERLLAIDPTINVVYTINEPAAAGAYEALRSLGLERVC
jgi:fructose transport system substrate-binding protein